MRKIKYLANKASKSNIYTIILLLFTIVSCVVLTPVSTVLASKYSTITVTYPYYGFVEDPEDPWQTAYDALDETGTVEYSDDFFLEPSPGDHPELRAMSYALALAGYENQSDGYPSTSSTKNPKLLGLLNQIGFSDYQIDDASSEEDGHSMGTTIGRKTLTNGQELVVIAPRNYNYMTEWLSNLNVGTSGDHAGFSESSNLITERFNTYITSRNLKNYKLWVVGYSRGGAVVDLFSRDLNENISNYQLSPDDFFAYTFGAPKASSRLTEYSNIHDVRDGNDLLLGYVFPAIWGFSNTGVYEVIHEADLVIPTSVVNIADLVDSSKVLEILSSDVEMTEKVGEMNGGDFVDMWLQFVTDNGLTRGYFDSEVKPALSAIMKAYQLRTLDRQSEFIDFIKNTTDGLAGMVAANAFTDLLTGGYGTSMSEALSNFPPYLDLVKILKGNASSSDIDELISYLTGYMGNYDDYEYKTGVAPTITEAEFAILKENLPKLVKALAPIIVADARYTQDTFGEDYSLYFTYTLVSNARSLLIGHIPESIMPILKSLIPDDEIVVPKVPNTGAR